MNAHRLILLLAAAVAPFLLASPVWAAGSLTADTLSPNMGTATIADFDAGRRDMVPGNTLTIGGLSASATWHITVKTTSANMGIVGSYTKPVSDFQWRQNGTSTFTTITTTEVTVASGVGNSKPKVDYRCLLSYANDVPGTYTISLTYTLISP